MKIRSGELISGDQEQLSIGMLSLGCPKNMVDSEVILGLLASRNYRMARHVSDCDVALVNTCAFIEDARKESVDSILELAQLKKQGRIRKLIVCGCLPQKYYRALQDGIAEIDAMVGSASYGKIAGVIESVMRGEKSVQVHDTRFIYDHSSPRYSLTPRHFKYIKIGEGCDHRCSFCIIPQLRGDYRSRSMDSIVQEAEHLASEGMKEAILISQDSSYYGRDLDGRYHLAELLSRLNGVSGLRWIRLLYNHPVHITDEILDAMARLDKVCKYIDIPLQHISDNMLRSMKRGMNKEKTISLIRSMREKVSGLAIRTTFIVGYPGETDQDFQELCDVVKEVKFERLGVFAYSQGDDVAGTFGGQIPPKIREQRRDILMRLQQGISREYHQRWVGRNLEVVIDDDDVSRNGYRGRSYTDAPEIDGQVLVRSPQRELEIGEFYSVEIVNSEAYDLMGIVR